MQLKQQLRTSFVSWDVEKVHAVVARSTFRSQKVQNHTMYGPLLEVKMSKKCTPLWREAHFQVKMYKITPCTDHFWRFRCRKKCTPLWREAHFQVKMYKTHHVRTTFGGSDVASLRFTTLHYTTLHSTTLHYTPLHYITLHYLPLHSATLNYTTFHYTPLHYAPLHYITLHYITLNDTAPQIGR